MKKFLYSAALLCCALALHGAALRPVALVGYKWDINELNSSILLPARVEAVRHINKWLPTADYGKFSAVYIGERLRGLGKNDNWNTPEAIKDVLAYLNNGGTIIASGNTPLELLDAKKFPKEFASIFGFARLFKPAKTKGMKVKGEKMIFPLNPTRVADKPAATLQVIGTLPGDNGKEYPVITSFAVGKGKVIWIAPCYNRFLLDCKKAGLEMGIPDDRGDYVLTDEGKTREMLIKFYTDTFLAIPQVKLLPPLEKWDNKPLGAPGNLTYTGKFKNKAVLKSKAPALKPGIPLCKEGKLAVIYTPAKDKRFAKLAGELKYHLDKMTGKSFTVTSKLPAASQNAIIFANEAVAAKYGIDIKKLGQDTMLLARKGNHQIISGKECGISQALTVLLESIGCRYLWPGADGKIIPKKAEVILPELNKCHAPKLLVRNIRERLHINSRVLSSLFVFGLTPNDYHERYKAAEVDAPGNRKYFEWHGLNDSAKTTGWVQGPDQSYEWGHSFNDFHLQHGRKNPGFFALQPDGKRYAMQRPRLCHSNPKLLDQIAADRIAKFRKYPHKVALSLCLSDGGYSSMCLCENCRKMDPVNAPSRNLLVFKPSRKLVPYVEFSDRVVAFSNSIVERVHKVMPEKRFTMYAYSSYVKPPVKVKPHPALIILTVDGLYVSDASRAAMHKSIASWASFGNPLLWRPNALQGHRYMTLPQNHARRMFNDVELYKANGLIGTDFDGLEKSWSCKAWIYYALSKAHWNCDRLDYDVIMNDFCEAGFGPAAPHIKAYLDKLEALTDEAAARNKSLGHSTDYADVVDAKAVAELNAHLAKAAEAAEKTPEYLKRVKFLQEGMKYADLNNKLTLTKDKDQKAYAKYQQELIDLVKTHVMLDPRIIGAPDTGFYNRHIPRQAKIKANLATDKYIQDNKLFHLIKR